MSVSGYMDSGVRRNIWDAGLLPCDCGGTIHPRGDVERIDGYYPSGLPGIFLVKHRSCGKKYRVVVVDARN